MVNGHSVYSVYSILACLEEGGRSRRQVRVENKIRGGGEGSKGENGALCTGGWTWPAGPERW